MNIQMLIEHLSEGEVELNLFFTIFTRRNM